MERRRIGGFSLVEVLVAMVMLALVTSVLLNVFITAGRVNKRGSDITRASLVASSLSERIKTDPATWAMAGTTTLYFDNDGNQVVSGNPSLDPASVFRASATVADGGLVPSPAFSIESAFVVDALTPNDPVVETYTLVCQDDGSGNPELVLDGDGATLTYALSGSLENPDVVTVEVRYMKANYATNPGVYPDVTLQTSNGLDSLLKLYLLTDTEKTITVEPVVGSVSTIDADPVSMNTGNMRLYDISVEVFGMAAGDTLAERTLSGFQWAAP